jgi:hypothetical protein
MIRPAARAVGVALAVALAGIGVSACTSNDNGGVIVPPPDTTTSAPAATTTSVPAVTLPGGTLPNS